MADLWHHPSPSSQDLSSLQSKRGRRKRLGANAGGVQPWAPKLQPGHNKARGGDPGRLRDREIRVSLVVGAELPALAPGAMCLSGRFVGSGAPDGLGMGGGAVDGDRG